MVEVIRLLIGATVRYGRGRPAIVEDWRCGHGGRRRERMMGTPTGRTIFDRARATDVCRVRARRLIVGVAGDRLGRLMEFNALLDEEHDD